MKVSADDIARLLASPPPRHVPPHVSKAAQGGMIVWLLVVFGMSTGLFGMKALWTDFPWRFYDEWRMEREVTAMVTGRVLQISEKQLTLTDDKVFEYRFSFNPPGGTSVSARCYTTGQIAPAGSQIYVRYLPARPEAALIVGARLSPGTQSKDSLLLIIIPLLGFAFAGLTWIHLPIPARLLRDGLVAEVKVLSVDDSTPESENPWLYRIKLTAPGGAGRPPIVVWRFNSKDIKHAMHHARHGLPVFVLYDPRRPARLIFPETLITPQAEEMAP